MSARVLKFPVRPAEPPNDRPLILAWYRCAGGCGGLVAYSGAVCVACIRGFEVGE